MSENSDPVGFPSLAGWVSVLIAAFYGFGASSYASKTRAGCLVGEVIDMIEAAML